MYSLTFPPVLGLNNLNVFLWDSMRKLLISDVISSFKEGLKLSKNPFSTLETSRLRGPQHKRLGLFDRHFPMLLVKLNLHLRSRCSPVGCSFFSGFLLLTFLDEEVHFQFKLTLEIFFSTNLNSKFSRKSKLRN